MPRITVGLATFNRPDGLKRTLAAVLAQTYQDLRVIVSDNCSSDSEVDRVLRDYPRRDSRVEVFRQSQNVGQLDNFRWLFEQAASEYFVWAADDDEWDPEFLEECVNLLERDAHAVLAFCHVRKKETQSGAILIPDYADAVEDRSPNRLNRLATYLMNSASNECVYGVFRTRAITPWFFRRAYGNDHLAMLSVLKQGHLTLSPRVLFSSGIGGLGAGRERYHEYYENRLMKVCVTLNSTLVWFLEFQHYAWSDPGYRVIERCALSLLICRRFTKWRFIRRFCGDLIALVTQRRLLAFVHSRAQVQRRQP